MPAYPTIKVSKMKYPSPSGFVYTGKYVFPFEPVKKGFGFKGVVLEDCETGKLNCSICNGWFEIFNSHLKHKHNMNSNEYRELFGLSRGTALKSKKVRLRQSKVMQEMRRKHKKHRMSFQKGNLFAGNRKNKLNSIETINKYGICDLQIADRVLKLKKKLGKTPTLTELKDEYGGAFIFHIHKRYKSYIILCRQLELTPHYSNHNPKYSREYFIEKGLSNEPALRILTSNEKRAMYKYFKNVAEWKKVTEKIRVKNG